MCMQDQSRNDTNVTDYTQEHLPIRVSQPSSTLSPHPFENWSISQLVSWMNSGSNSKSIGEVDRLVHEVLLAPNFNAQDLVGFSARRENERLYGGKKGPELNDGWVESDVEISVPCDGVKHASESIAPVYHLRGFLYRRLMDVIRSAMAEKSAAQFILNPYKAYWQETPGSQRERLYSELYTSDIWIKEHEKIISQTRTDSCTLEGVIIPLML